MAGGIRNPARLEKCHLAEAASPGSTGSFPGYRQCAGSFSQNPTSRRIDYILVATGHSSEVHTEWLLPGYPPQVGNHGRRTFAIAAYNSTFSVTDARRLSSENAWPA